MGKASSLTHCKRSCEEGRICDGKCFENGYEYALMDMQCLEDHNNVKQIVSTLQTLGGEVLRLSKIKTRDRILSAARRLKQYIGE
jgi:hypothetical protein